MNLQLIVALSLVDGVGPKTVGKIVDEFGALDKLDTYIEHSSFPQDLKYKLLRQMKPAEAVLEDLEQNKVSLVYRGQEQYPPLLAQIPDPPTVLIYRGNYDLIEAVNVAIVGSRRANPQGKRLAHETAEVLCANGVSVVSGMAFGIDSVAHKSALNNKGNTIAVLASDVMTPSPQGNSRVYEQILSSGGLVVSETLPGQPVLKSFFVRRNRIIAALCQTTVIVQASITSGALHTARLALDYNRDVFAYPGAVDDESMAGNNKLIADQVAQLITAPAYLAECLSLGVRRTPIKVPEPALYELIRQHGCVSLEFLCAMMKIDLTDIIGKITRLEAAGFIEQTSVGYQIRI